MEKMPTSAPASSTTTRWRKPLSRMTRAASRTSIVVGAVISFRDR